MICIRPIYIKLHIRAKAPSSIFWEWNERCNDQLAFINHPSILRYNHLSFCIATEKNQSADRKIQRSNKCETITTNHSSKQSPTIYYLPSNYGRMRKRNCACTRNDVFWKDKWPFLLLTVWLKWLICIRETIVAGWMTDCFQTITHQNRTTEKA